MSLWQSLLPLCYHFHKQWTRQPYLISFGGWFTQTQWTHQLLPCWLVNAPMDGGCKGDHVKWHVNAAAMTATRQVGVCACQCWKQCVITVCVCMFCGDMSTHIKGQKWQVRVCMCVLLDRCINTWSTRVMLCDPRHVSVINETKGTAVL